MAWPQMKKKKKVIEPPLYSLEEQQKMVSELLLVSKYRVMRDDWQEAYLKALIELHPEANQHPEVLAYNERHKEYEEVKLGGRD